MYDCVVGFLIVGGFVCVIVDYEVFWVFGDFGVEVVY